MRRFSSRHRIRQVETTPSDEGIAIDADWGFHKGPVIVRMAISLGHDTRRATQGLSDEGIDDTFGIESAAIRCGSVAGSVSDLTHRLPKPLSTILRYGLAVLSVALALAGALVADRYNFRGVEFPFFLFAIAATVWYVGPGPAVLTLVLSSVAFNYFFTEPFYTLYVTGADLPYLRRLSAIRVSSCVVQRRSSAGRARASAIPRRACERGGGTNPAGARDSRPER